MENCTYCPFIRYWYIILAAVVVIWAISRFRQGQKEVESKEISGVSDLTAENFADEVASGITLVDFWATWCPPCRKQLPIIEETVADLPEGTKIAKVNIDSSGDLAKKFGVSSISTWIIFKDGEEVERITGLQSKSDLLKLAKRE